MNKELIINDKLFSKEFMCDVCGTITACIDSFDPPSCMNCNDWGKPK